MIVRSRSSANNMNQSDTEKDVIIGNHNTCVGTAKTPGGTRLWRLLIGISVLGIIAYIFLLASNSSSLHNRSDSDSASFEKLTIVLNTFKRHEMLSDAVDYYSQCNLVKYIYVVWSEVDQPPAKLVDKFNSSVRPKIVFSKQETDSLNNRFRPLDGPHSDAILSVDDDMRIPCADLNLAYEVWRGSPRSLIGFMPRIHLRQQNGRLVYRCWWRVWWHGVYSIILTKAAIMSHEYFGLYTSNMPQAVRDLVNSKRNCEDIAMQFLIANHTSLPPIYVKGHLEDKGALNGISTSQNVVKAQHMGARSDCLNELEAIYGRLPLVMSHIIVDGAANGWTNAPSTWFEYFSSDLWKF